MTPAAESEGTSPGEAAKPVTQYFYKRNLQTKRFEYISPQAAEMIGTSTAKLLEETSDETQERIHPEDREGVIKSHREFIAKRSGTLTTEFRVKRDNGEYIWVRHTAEVVPDSDGRGNTLVGMVSDITESKSMQTHLAELQLRYEHLWKKARLAICESRVGGNAIVSCNERWARLRGYDSIEECIRQSVPRDEYVDPKIREEVIAQFAAGARSVEVEAEVRRKDGIPVWLRLSYSKHPDGDVVDVVGADITVEKLLSPSETEVLRHLIAGLSNKEIALKLCRSLRTIENHRASIMGKLGVNTSIALAKRVADCDFS